MTTPRSVRVVTTNTEYDVRIGTGVLDTIYEAVIRSAPKARRVHAIVDSGVPSELVDRALKGITAADLGVTRSEITPTERVKVTTTWHEQIAYAAAARLDRSDVILAIGGGIVGDIAGFVGASYRRGLHVIQCPTTLLAMVDASVGGKTGVNLETETGLLKNAIGAFHQPVEVVSDIESLRSLSPRVFRAGLAECVKHSLLSGDFGDAQLGYWMRDRSNEIVAQDADVLAELVSRNVAVKAAVVATDEKETSSGDMGRALLNLGHTFAHAIETLPGVRVPMGDDDSPIMHGEAVSLGLVAAASMSEDLGKTSGLIEPLKTWLTNLGLPTRCEGLSDVESILERMVHDKKASGGTIRFVIPTSEGSSRVIESPGDALILKALEAIRA